LDEYRREFFDKQPGIDGQPRHFHRITLYRYAWHWCFRGLPWSGWLVPVARSGHTSRSGLPTFKAPINKPDDAEGIAGQAWVNWGTVTLSDLPDMHENTPSDESVAEYARQAWVSEKWLRRRIGTSGRSNARSFLGIPVDVKGKKWGVLVVDSRISAEIVNPETLGQNPYRTMMGVLVRLIERV
jgi:hypothetical protein